MPIANNKMPRRATRALTDFSTIGSLWGLSENFGSRPIAQSTSAAAARAVRNDTNVLARLGSCAVRGSRFFKTKAVSAHKGNSATIAARA